jgi:hypothetical protein
VPTITRTWVSRAHRVHVRAVAAQDPLTEHHGDRGAGQPGRERDRADHDGLGGQHPATVRRRHERDAEQVPPVLGRDEHRAHDGQHDEPGERADEGLRS